jgi:hypothetical protein
VRNINLRWLGTGLGCIVIWLPSPSKSAPQPATAPQRPVLVASARPVRTAQSAREAGNKTAVKVARTRTVRPGRKQVLWTD